MLNVNHQFDSEKNIVNSVSAKIFKTFADSPVLIQYIGLVRYYSNKLSLAAMILKDI